MPARQVEVAVSAYRLAWLRILAPKPVTDVVQLGPLALAADRLFAVTAVWVFAAVVPWLLGDDENHRQAVTWLTLGAGLVAARIGYVALHSSAFMVEPATILYVWQGGFDAAAGIAGAAVLVLALKTFRSKARALGATAAIAGLWFAITTAIAAKDAPLLPQGLSARQMDGQKMELADLRGTPFVINIWATWCPPCQREMPLLASVARGRPDTPILFVNQGEDAVTVARFLQEKNLSIPHPLLDESGSFGRALGGTGLPTTIFVDAGGHVRISHVGEISRAALEEGLELIASSRPGDEQAFDRRRLHLLLANDTPVPSMDAQRHPSRLAASVMLRRKYGGTFRSSGDQSSP